MTDDRLPLAELLAKAGDSDFLRSVAKAVVQLLMETDVERVIGAGRHERTGDRTTYRNGYRERTLDTRLGALQLRIPKTQAGQLLSTFLEPTVLSVDDEAIIVAFRRHTLLPLDDCLYALQATIPHLTRSSLHRCLRRHGISRLPDVTGDKAEKRRFKAYPLGYFHIDIAEVRTEQGKLYLFVAID